MLTSWKNDVPFHSSKATALIRIVRTKASRRALDRDALAGPPVARGLRQVTDLA